MKKLSLMLASVLLLTGCGTEALSQDEINKMIDEKISQIEFPEPVVPEVNTLSSFSEELKELAKEASKSVFMLTCFDREEKGISSGSGALFSEDDEYYYGFTNYHVVDDATTYKVNFIADRSYDATLVAGSKETDLAVIKIKKADVKDEVKLAKFANYDDIDVGEIVVAIGSPNGINYFNSVTMGIVSGKDRMIEISDSNDDGVKDYLMKMVQHDAAINHGNSGGPLFNLNGEVVGINTLKIIYQDAESMGGAIACDYASRVLYELLENQKFEIVTLGIYGTIYAVETGNPDINGGVQIKEIIPDGSVDKSKANILPDDILIELNGKEIYNLIDVRNALFVINKGETVEAKVYRKGEIVTTSVTFN